MTLLLFTAWGNNILLLLLFGMVIAISELELTVNPSSRSIQGAKSASATNKGQTLHEYVYTQMFPLGSLCLLLWLKTTFMWSIERIYRRNCFLLTSSLWFFERLWTRSLCKSFSSLLICSGFLSVMPQHKGYKESSWFAWLNQNQVWFGHINFRSPLSWCAWPFYLAKLLCGLSGEERVLMCLNRPTFQHCPLHFS